MRYTSVPMIFIGSLLSACASGPLSFDRLPGPRDLPFIHKIDIQQGNVLSQEMVAQLRRGMDKKKVQFVMGTPVIQDTFNADRWDYVYTFQEDGGTVEKRHIELVFADEKLDHLEGNVKPAASLVEVARHQDTTVDVPKNYKKGFISRIKEKMPFSGDEDKAQEGKNKTAKVGGKDGKTALTASADKSDPAAATKVAAVDNKDDVPVPEDPSVEMAKPQRHENPYDNIQAAPGEGVVVPPDAPRHERKKGFLTRIVDSIGLGADEDDTVSERAEGPAAPTYRDVTNPNER